MMLKKDTIGGLTMDQFAGSLVKLLAELMKARVAPLEEARKELSVRMDMHDQYIVRALERLDAVEARPQLKFCGVWKPETQYQTDSLVTHGGGLWYAQGFSSGVRPGTGDGLWRLAVKSGRDTR